MNRVRIGILAIVVLGVLSGCLEWLTNDDPVFTGFSPTGNPTITEGDSQEFSVTAQDADGDPLSYLWYVNSVEQSTTTSTFTFSTSSGDAGTYAISVVVSDGNGGQASHEWTLTVSAGTANTPPVIDSFLPSGDPTIALGDSQEFSVSASDPDSDTLSYAWYVDSALQSETTSSFTYDSAAGVAGTYAISVTVSDGNGGDDTQGWTLEVTDALNSITGTVNYTGAGGIATTRPLRVEAVTNETLTVIDSVQFTAPPYDFSLSVDDGVYNVFAYVDDDETGTLSPGDPFVLYQNVHDLFNPNPVAVSADVSIGTMDLDDETMYGFVERLGDGTIDALFTDSDPRWTVSGGHMVMTGTGSDDLVMALLDYGDVDDFYFRCDSVEQTNGSYLNTDWGFFFRMNLVTEEGYALAFDDQQGFWGVYVNGVLNHYEATYDPGDSVGIRFVGTTLTVYIDGVEEWQTDLTGGNTSGYFGLYCWDDHLSPPYQQYEYGDMSLVIY